MSFEVQYKRSSYIPTSASGSKTYLDSLSSQYIQQISNIKTFTFYNIEAHYENRLDLISNKFYQTPDLWWVISQYNGFINPLFEVVTGKTIKIPDRASIDQALSRASSPQTTTSVNTVSLE